MRLLRIGSTDVAKVQAGLRALPADQQELRGPVMNGYNFTERVRKTLALAREAAARLRHEYVGTEHVLLGLLREGQGVGVAVLENLRVDLAALADDVEQSTKPTAARHTGPDLPYTSRAKKALELAMAEARELDTPYVGTEHMLLGLLREEKGLAATALARAGVTLDAAREETRRILGAGPRLSPVSSMPSVGSARSWQTLEPWRILAEPARRVVQDAYVRARAVGRVAPDTADLLAAMILSSPEISAALSSRRIEIDGLIADVRRAGTAARDANRGGTNSEGEPTPTG
ncbi:MAG TPA: Clp protease N-terminal domain-containing protein [Gemmatimonadaceae bacterium]|nr:Clp protease N-terminal domain-containing protein [Gemmatimonadaceae bacterium]